MGLFCFSFLSLSLVLFHACPVPLCNKFVNCCVLQSRDTPSSPNNTKGALSGLEGKIALSGVCSLKPQIAQCDVEVHSFCVAESPRSALEHEVSDSGLEWCLTYH